MPYNLSLINGSGIAPMLQTVNDELMFGWYGVLGLITLFILFYMGFVAKTNNARKSLAFSSLFTALSSVLFRTIEIINDTTLLITWILVAFLIALSYMSKE